MNVSIERFLNDTNHTNGGDIYSPILDACLENVQSNEMIRLNGSFNNQLILDRSKERAYHNEIASSEMNSNFKSIDESDTRWNIQNTNSSLNIGRYDDSIMNNIIDLEKIETNYDSDIDETNTTFQRLVDNLIDSSDESRSESKDFNDTVLSFSNVKLDQSNSRITIDDCGDSFSDSNGIESNRKLNFSLQQNDFNEKNSNHNFNNNRKNRNTKKFTQLNDESKSNEKTISETFSQDHCDLRNSKQIYQIGSISTELEHKQTNSIQSEENLFEKQVKFAQKLGYSTEQVRLALKRLGANCQQNELLAELIKISADLNLMIRYCDAIEPSNENNLSNEEKSKLISTSIQNQQYSHHHHHHHHHHQLLGSSISSSILLDSNENVENPSLKVEQINSRAVIGKTLSSPIIGDDHPSKASISKQSNSNLRAIVIDGSNVAANHGQHKCFSSRGIQICIEWFQARGHDNITTFVPSWRKSPKANFDLPTKDRDILIKLQQEGYLYFTPSRTVSGKMIASYDDRYILNYALKQDAVIVSNDEFRDLKAENPEYKKLIDERLLTYLFVKDEFMPPEDPLGQHGPSLTKLLSKSNKTNATVKNKSKFNQPCPYNKKCTYGNKCKYLHENRNHSASFDGSIVESSMIQQEQNNKLKIQKSLPLNRSSNQSSIQGPIQPRTAFNLSSSNKNLLIQNNTINTKSIDPILVSEKSLYRSKSTAMINDDMKQRANSRLPGNSKLHRKLERQLTLNPDADPRLMNLRTNPNDTDLSLTDLKSFGSNDYGLNLYDDIDQINNSNEKILSNSIAKLSLTSFNENQFDCNNRVQMRKLTASSSNASYIDSRSISSCSSISPLNGPFMKSNIKSMMESKSLNTNLLSNNQSTALYSTHFSTSCSDVLQSEEFDSPLNSMFHFDKRFPPIGSVSEEGLDYGKIIKSEPKINSQSYDRNDSFESNELNSRAVESERSLIDCSLRRLNSDDQRKQNHHSCSSIDEDSRFIDDLTIQKSSKFDEIRSKIYYHLSFLFPCSIVYKAMEMMPNETDSYAICETIIKMRPSPPPPPPSTSSSSSLNQSNLNQDQCQE
ncbi:17 beta-hydroxysteroid dehydrogenase [Sarcoptes scabiei]|nr:17 beta-hydroxysteroid dehydrogenase [Sarcoptes scabiei]